MKRSQSGFSLQEVLGALFVGGMMMIGLSTLINNTMEDTKAQQAALYQSQVTNAAEKYITANYDKLLAKASATTPYAITISDLQAGSTHYLSTNFQAQNAYGQTPCVLVLQPTSKILDALIVTEGGTNIPDSDIGYASANAGKGGGYITHDNTGAVNGATGVFGSWKLTKSVLDNYLKTSCSATTADKNHLATALFYDGPGMISTEFLYRNAVSKHPELNEMSTPLRMTYKAPRNGSDLLCTATDPSTYGRIALDANNTLVTCQNGIWTGHGAGTWREPVPSYAALPTTGNVTGDVRMVTGGTAANRAFTWNGATWVALAVDQNGLLTTNQVQINSVVVKGNACTSNGLVARDSSGLLLSCQSNVWGSLSTVDPGYSEVACRRLRPSKYSTIDAAACPKTYTSGWSYVSATDTWGETIVRPVPVAKNGLISATAWSQMNRGLASGAPADGQMALSLLIRDSGTGAVLATTQSQSPALHNDSAGVSISLSKAVPWSAAGYTVEISTYYSLFDGGSGTFDEANYNVYGGGVVQQTPLTTGWDIDLYY